MAPTPLETTRARRTKAEDCWLGLAEDVAYLSWRRAGAGCGGPRSAVQ